MTLIVADRIQETSNTTGTGTLTLLGATTGFQSFAAVGNGNTTYYGIINAAGQWEVGLGTYTLSGTTLARTTILASSNGGSVVNFTSTPLTVFVTYPAGKSVYLDAAGNVKPSLGTATFSSITDSGLTSGRVTYAGTGGLLQDSANLTFDGTTLTSSFDALVNGLTVGKGAGAIATNTANGVSALQSNTTGFQNTANGYQALLSNTTGNYNTANGFQALFSNTTGVQNTASGRYALYNNTTGIQNTASGMSALLFNTTGTQNTANGFQALFSNISGVQNTANGFQALFSNTSDYNTASGRSALFSNTTGFQNTASGGNALFSNTTGNYNTANGYQALTFNTTGSNNTASGVNALQSNTTGNNNIALGTGAGNALTTGSNNTIIGSIAGTAGLADTIIIGAGTTERMRIDSSGNTYLGGAPGAQSLQVNRFASAVNYLQVTGSATGNATTISAQGSDTNIGITLTPKGTGTVQYGTYTAGVLTPTGYITITDSGGTVRRLLVG